MSPPPAPAVEYPVFVKGGDAVAEVEATVRGLGGTAERAGLHKVIYVQRADQTVVMTTSRDAPIATALRASGWTEPREME